MNSQEILIAPEPTPVDVQVVTLPMDAEAGYAYQRADGTIERAFNAEDAIARCPVLGKLAMEAPEQANLLLELAAAGRAKMQVSETQKRSKAESKSVPEQKPEPMRAARPSAKVAERGHTNMTHEGVPVAILPRTEEPPRTHSEVIKRTVTVKRSSTEAITEIPAAESLRDEPVKDSKTLVALHSSDEVLESDVVTVESEPASMSEGQGTGELSNCSTIALNELGISAIPQETKTAADEQLDLLFDAETVDAYKELVALAAAEVDPSVPATSTDVKENGFDNATIVTAETDADSEALLDFGVLIAEQPADNKTVTLELIQVQAADSQPLEQSFVQLAELLADAPETLEQTEIGEIMQAIKAALPACYIIQEGGEPKPQITPVTTEKLLMLLRALGYGHPKNTLVECVGKHGLVFLLQAISYLSYAYGTDEARVTMQPPAYVQPNGDITRLRLSKMLFGLVARNVLPSQTDPILASL